MPLPQPSDAVPPTPAGARTRAARSQVRTVSRSSTTSTLSATTASTVPSPHASIKRGNAATARNKVTSQSGAYAAKSTAASLGKSAPAPKAPAARSRNGSAQSASSLSTPTAHRKMGMTAIPASVSRIRANNSPLKALDNSPARVVSEARAAALAGKVATKKLAPPPPALEGTWGDAEPIKAFLRIRPAPDDTERSEPYIHVVSDTEVLMSPPDPLDPGVSRHNQRSRKRTGQPPTKYSFSRVFAPETVAGDGAGIAAGSKTDYDGSQASFFRHTTLPMVQEVLQGQSGLVFTYGVTNSGKSYTVQGGEGKNDAGILPRAMDTIFNSIEGLESTHDIRPVGLVGVERCSPENANTSQPGVNPFSLPALSSQLPSNRGAVDALYESETTSVKVDRNLRYSVWVSYVEVYNEKLFDLLDVAPVTVAATSSSGGLTRSMPSNWSISSLGGTSTPSNESITLNRKPLQLKRDHEAGGKYVAGLRDVRVHSAAEARELLKRGQENRAVFGTMANRASSRSHGVFTVKILREHAGTDADESTSLNCSTSRLSIVDLAGSERVANTGVTNGDRLKEAGNINKSLMCLGQCLETLRKNQARAWSAIPAPLLLDSSSAASDLPFTSSSGSASPRPLFKRRPSIVPFRHSKLTELFESFFTGDGRAVMIVNANPYDTGFDENNHVMRFSAAAKEVHTLQRPGGNARTMVNLKGLFEDKANPCHTQEDPNETKMQRRITMPPDVTIIEESDDDADEEDARDPFVEYLVQKHEELAQQLFDAQMRCAMIETEVREEMAAEMDERLQEMETAYNERVMADAEQHEELANRKLDLLTRFNASEKKQQAYTSWTGRTPGTAVRNRLEEEEVEGALASIEERDDPESPTIYVNGQHVLLLSSDGEDSDDVSDNDSIQLVKGRHGFRRTLSLDGKAVSDESVSTYREDFDGSLEVDGIADEDLADLSAKGLPRKQEGDDSPEKEGTEAEILNSTTSAANKSMSSEGHDSSGSDVEVSPPICRSMRASKPTSSKDTNRPARVSRAAASARSRTTHASTTPLAEIAQGRKSKPLSPTSQSDDSIIVPNKGGKRKVRKLRTDGVKIGAQPADSSLVRAMEN